ncbi:MAG: putative zinc-binding protein [Eubacterium aggregans]|uniref:DGC domain-containing protein n=1 Tax=Eubacterium aggregans TaxID=81409 RepID=A0A1H4CH43_9FIRM|nr:putative zinc-binding protein [Eubacterium aggregans]MDD4691556.1 putative zinc-binding protein [Eubacterium aggregans]MEA5074460.1 putative zinc-binding protein [Eubacterium aggregans]SEA59731.1 DGC domain-containing protein [Eubacterium aggregans]
MAEKNIGYIACSGEECLGGTLSRLVVRKMMEELRPGQVSTLCLPLFIAGGEQEQAFAQTHPTISVDGCSKCCAKRATEALSGQLAGSIDIEALIGSELALNPDLLSMRDLTPEHFALVDRIAQKACDFFDRL